MDINNCTLILSPADDTLVQGPKIKKYRNNEIIIICNHGYLQSWYLKQFVIDSYFTINNE